MRHPHADLIHSFAEGARIECSPSNGSWIEINNPTWSVDCKYRLMEGCNRGVRHPLADLLHAYAEGVKIEWYSPVGEWMELDYPSWRIQDKYRRKPISTDIYMGIDSNNEVFITQNNNGLYNLRCEFNQETGMLSNIKIITMRDDAT